MEQGGSDKVLVDLGFVSSLVQWILDRLRPVIDAIERVAGESSAGFVVIFFIFFSIFLIRNVAGSRSSTAFGAGIYHLGGHGIAAAILVGFLKLFEFVFMAYAVIPVQVSLDWLLGDGPSPAEFYAFWDSPSEASTAFNLQVMSVSSHKESLIPLSSFSLFLILTAFLCMRLVGSIFVRWETSHSG